MKTGQLVRLKEDVQGIPKGEKGTILAQATDNKFLVRFIFGIARKIEIQIEADKLAKVKND